MKPSKGRNQVKTHPVRRGAAVAELALCLPLILVLVLGSIEACNLLFLRQALVAAAYDGALLGSQLGTTESEIVNRVQTTLAARNITVDNVAVQVTGSNYDALPEGGKFTVHVEAPMAANNLGLTMFARFDSLDADIAAHKQ